MIDIERIMRAMRYNSTDFGEQGRYIRIDYVRNILVRENERKENMENIEAGTLKVSASTCVGEQLIRSEPPTRVDFQYALSLGLNGQTRYAVRDNFEWRLACDDEEPSTWDNYDEAEQARRAVDLTYKNLGISAEVTVVARSIRTYVDSWTYFPKQELGPLT